MIIVHMFLMRDDKEERKKQARLNKQQCKATQHTQGSHFSLKNELPRVGLEPTTLYTLDRALYQLSYQGSISLFMFSPFSLSAGAAALS